MKKTLVHVTSMEPTKVVFVTVIPVLLVDIVNVMAIQSQNSRQMYNVCLRTVLLNSSAQAGVPVFAAGASVNREVLLSKFMESSANAITSHVNGTWVNCAAAKATVHAIVECVYVNLDGPVPTAHVKNQMLIVTSLAWELTICSSKTDNFNIWKLRIYLLIFFDLHKNIIHLYSYLL